MISLAGIPLTAGFIGKFYLFSAAVQKGYMALAIIGVLNSVVSVYYYFRLIIVMYMRDAAEGEREPDAVSLPVLAVIGISAAGVLWLGVLPSWILHLARYSSLALK